MRRFGLCEVLPIAVEVDPGRRSALADVGLGAVRVVHGDRDDREVLPDQPGGGVSRGEVVEDLQDRFSAVKFVAVNAGLQPERGGAVSDGCVQQFSAFAGVPADSTVTRP
jgi:hypothetical protein